MPAKDLLAKQRMLYQIGRIRTGAKRVTSNGKEAPIKLETLRFTSAAKPAIEEVARQYGGDVRPWDNRGHQEFEVVTNVKELLVTIPPEAEAISMWYEMWTKGGCKRKCDSEFDQKSGGPCLCAPLLERYPEEDRGRQRALMAKGQSPQTCFLQTRVSFILPDLPDVGVWRLDTKSYYGAEGMLGKLRIMEMARKQGVFLPARLWIDHQVDFVGGQTRKYPVPQISLLNTVREIATGQLREGGLAAQLPPAPGEERLAITGGARPVPEPRPEPKRQRTAQQIADDAANATTREAIEALAAEMEEARCEEDYVCTDRNADLHEELRGYLQTQWKRLPSGGGDQ